MLSICLTHLLPVCKEKIAFVGDLQKLRYGQNHVERILRSELTDNGMTERAAELGGMLGGLLAYRKCGSYQIDQRHLADKMESLYRTRRFSRNYISELEHCLARLGYIDIPKFKFRPEMMRTKVRKFTDRFVALVSRCMNPDTIIMENMQSVAQSDMEFSVGYSCDSEPPVLKTNTVRTRVEKIIDRVKTEIARPSRSTLFDWNHRNALRLKGVVQTQPSRVDRQFLFHCQKAIPEDVRALEFFVDTIRRREEGDVDTVAFFERWSRIPKKRRTDEVMVLCGMRHIRKMARHGLHREERQFLFHCQKATPDLLESIKLFVDVLRLKRNGDELVIRFFSRWDDLLCESKPGMVRDLRRSLGDTLPSDVAVRDICDRIRPPPEYGEPAPVFDGLPGSMSEEEHARLMRSLLPGVTYDGPHAEILTRLRAMSTLELDGYLEWVNIIPSTE